MQGVDLGHGVKFSYIGPSLEEGPLPAVVYLALSDSDSLTVDPYNQFPLFLSSHGIRVFTLMIPGHEHPRKPETAIAYWAERTALGDSLIMDFITGAVSAIEALLRQPWMIPEKIAIAGLSRGGYLASHIAARTPHIKTVLGFAPLTDLSKSEDFAHIKEHPLVDALSLDHVLDRLCHKRIRYYIGNRDTRVGTERCFSLVHKLADLAYEQRVRVPPIELIIAPSIGYMGHGTAKHTFQAGAEWILSIFS